MEHEYFGVTVFNTGEVATVSASGELDVSSIDLFRSAIDQALAASRRIEIDLRELDFLDSSGLKAIVAVHNRSESEGFTYQVVAGPPKIHRTFELAGLDQVLTFA